jgi:four helix bundle protein
MAKFEKFEDIESWKIGRQIVNEIYDLTSVGKFSIDYVLRDQMRRAAISIIAEGFEREGNKEFIQFLSVAKASCGEIRSQLYIAQDREYISRNQFDQLVEKLLTISRTTSGLIKYLRNSELKGSKY